MLVAVASVHSAVTVIVCAAGIDRETLPARNPSASEYLEEERLSVLEGKLKGCTSVAVAEWVVFGVKP